MSRKKYSVPVQDHVLEEEEKRKEEREEEEIREEEEERRYVHIQMSNSLYTYSSEAGLYTCF